MVDKDTMEARVLAAAASAARNARRTARDLEAAREDWIEAQDDPTEQRIRAAMELLGRSREVVGEAADRTMRELVDLVAALTGQTIEQLIEGGPGALAALLEMGPEGLRISTQHAETPDDVDVAELHENLEGPSEADPETTPVGEATIEGIDLDARIGGEDA